MAAIPPSSPSDGATESPVQFCTFCAKPFTVTSSYKRHLSYCRRNRNRTRKRAQSCHNCRQAKSKCSSDARCTRCVNKNLRCVYGNPNSLGHAPSVTEEHPLESLTEPPSLGHLSAFELQHGPAVDFLGVHGFAEPSQGVPSNASWPPHDQSINIAATDGYWTIENFKSTSLGSFSDVGDLTQLRKPDPTAQQGAVMLLQSLRSYPEKMLRRDNFPPFVHPQWYRQALPEPLAICMKISQMFTTRTPEILPFLWRTIRAEQIRVLKEHENMAKADFMAGIQAQMVYMTMRVVDGSTEDSEEWTREMLILGAVLCLRFSEMYGEPFYEDEMSRPSLTWEDWVLAESRRRTGCAWFLLSRIVDLRTGVDCDVVENFLALPLPCSKLQWEANSHAAWLEGLGPQDHNLWTFRNLRETQERSDEAPGAQQLDSWNAKADTLGTLMSIAATFL
ncbi:hypothetical protein F4778DRAFT_748450 [Xylariomycetidae sp. FL2044]|nr:hypothetical protein F4778DRAFT_748450 [Xylariomycetidae sp. FL2044]